MKNYYRITIYHEEQNISAIIDSYGRFESLFQFCCFMYKHDFKITDMQNFSDITDSNISTITPSDKLIIRACAFGKPERNNGIISVNGKYYKE